MANNVTATSDFNQETKRMFSTCKFAAANIVGMPAGMRNVWGDFTSKKQATEAASMWMKTFQQFSPKLEAKIVGKAYRIAVIF